VIGKHSPHPPLVVEPSPRAPATIEPDRGPTDDDLEPLETDRTGCDFEDEPTVPGPAALAARVAVRAGVRNLA